MSRNYSRKGQPLGSDLALIWDSENSDWRLATLDSVVALYQGNVVFEKDVQHSTPVATPFTVGVNDNSNDTHLLLQTASVEGTIVFPPKTSLRDKQVLLITSLNAIPTLTLDKNGATDISGDVTSIDAGGFLTYKYDTAGDTWHRVG